MSVEFMCGDPAVLAGYLYNECDASERAAFEAHLAVCPACAAELSALGATRTALAAWTPPDAKLAFRITSEEDESGRVLRPPQWWQRPLPAWAQAVAATLIFVTGAALGMRSAGQAPEERVRTAAGASSTVSTSAVSTNAAAGVSAHDLAALEEKLRAEMRTLRTGATTSPAVASSNTEQPPVAVSDTAVLQQVRRLVAESEQRQQRELALRLTQVMRDVDSQRRMDLARIEQTFGQMEGFTRPELADQRQMLNYLIQRTGLRAPQ